MNRSHWIWYPGDFEIYHGMMQNFSREERGFIWPAYYHLDDCRKHVRFTREYNLEKEETVTVYANCLGYYRINDVKNVSGNQLCADLENRNLRFTQGCRPVYHLCGLRRNHHFQSGMACR